MKYYLHDSNAFNDEKVSELFIEYGYEGLGLFYTILEKLAGQEKPIKTTVLKHQLKVGKKLEKCWNFMESLGIISSNNGETFNKQLLNFSEKYQLKKEKNAKRISEWRENQEVTENVTRSENVRNTPKDNISKVKESKVNTYVGDVCDFIPDEEDKKNCADADLTVLCLRILHDFGFSEMRDHGKRRHISAFLNHLEIEKKLDWFILQYPAYWQYKKVSREKKQYLETFLGWPENLFENAGWEKANWIDELKNYNDGKSKSTNREDRQQSVDELTRAAEAVLNGLQS